MNINGPVSLPIGFGTWGLGGKHWPPVPQAKRIIQHAWELGFTHFDCAESYGNAEQLLGQALRIPLRSHREHIRIASKTALRPAAAVIKRVEKCLRRMGLDYIDLYYIHWPRSGMSMYSALDALHTLRERGLVKAVGICNVSTTEYYKLRSRFAIDVLQIGYNLIWRRAEAEWGSPAAAANMQVQNAPYIIAYSPLAQGLLAHPFPQDPAWHPADHRPHTPLFSAPAWQYVQAFTTAYFAVCTKYAIHPAALAVLWLLRKQEHLSLSNPQPVCSAAVAGPRSIAQLDSLCTGLHHAQQNPHAVRQAITEAHAASDTLFPHLPKLSNMFGYKP